MKTPGLFANLPPSVNVLLPELFGGACTMTSLVNELNSGGTDPALTMPEAWCLSDKDNSVYLESTKYPQLLQRFKEDTFRIQNQVRLMGETEAEKPLRAARVADEAAVTLQALWDLLSRMRTLTCLWTEHGILVPRTDLRGDIQNTLYFSWCQQNVDVDRGPPHKRLEMLMPNNWRSPTTTGLSRDLVQLVQTHAQKKVLGKGKGKGKGTPVVVQPSSLTLSDDGLVVDPKRVEPPMKLKKDLFSIIRKDMENTTRPDQERPPNISIFAEGFMKMEREGVYAAGSAAEHFSARRSDLPACVGPPRPQGEYCRKAVTRGDPRGPTRAGEMPRNHKGQIMRHWSAGRRPTGVEGNLLTPLETVNK